MVKLNFLLELTTIWDYFVLKNQLWHSTETLFFLKKKTKKPSSNNAKMTKKFTILNFSFDTLEAVEANLSVQNPF